MKCQKCDFETNSEGLLQVHYDAVHVQEAINELAASVREKENNSEIK